MKKNKKSIQALVVILVVGFGLLLNMDRKIHFSDSFNPITMTWNDESIDSDSLRTKNNSLFIYTGKIISSGINHLISNL